MITREFYIEHERQHVGPYDVMSVIRKIRNGEITRQTLIHEEGDETSRAVGEDPLFSEIFAEMDREGAGEEGDNKLTLGIKELFRNATDVLLQNMVMSVFTGIALFLIIVSVLGVYMFSHNVVVTSLLGAILGYFLFTLYQMSILRKTRMQLIGKRFFVSLIKRSGRQLLIVSAIIGTLVFALPVLLSQLVGPLALALILLPGSFVLLAMFYAPILVADRGIGAMAALRGSISAVKSLGRDNIITIYLVLLINFIGAGAFFVPLLITLPLTIAILCEIYDDHLNQFRVG